MHADLKSWYHLDESAVELTLRRDAILPARHLIGHSDMGLNAERDTIGKLPKKFTLLYSVR